MVSKEEKLSEHLKHLYFCSLKAFSKSFMSFMQHLKKVNVLEKLHFSALNIHLSLERPNKQKNIANCGN